LLVWLAWQVGSGLSNVILGWPLLAALAHTAGAAAVMAAGVAVLGMTRAQPSTLPRPDRIRHDAQAPGSTPA
jgi:cytochrome c oxidase assembly protein subunit 15